MSVAAKTCTPTRIGRILCRIPSVKRGWYSDGSNSLAKPAQLLYVAQPLGADFRQRAIHLDLVDPDVDIIEQCLIVASQQHRHINRIEYVVGAHRGDARILARHVDRRGGVRYLGEDLAGNKVGSRQFVRLKADRS